VAIPVDRLIQISDHLLRVGHGEDCCGLLRLSKASSTENDKCKSRGDFAKIRNPGCPRS
jgi:hypothetical protein